jgi:UDP-glucose 4-epimerase
VGSETAPRFAPVRPGEVQRIALDATKAQRDLGWSWKVDFIEGVAGAVEFYRDKTKREQS